MERKNGEVCKKEVPHIPRIEWDVLRDRIRNIIRIIRYYRRDRRQRKIEKKWKPFDTFEDFLNNEKERVASFEREPREYSSNNKFPFNLNRITEAALDFEGWRETRTSVEFDDRVYISMHGVRFFTGDLSFVRVNEISSSFYSVPNIFRVEMYPCCRKTRDFAVDIEVDRSVEAAIETFFTWTGGKVDKLMITGCRISNDDWESGTSAHPAPRIPSIITGRPITATLLYQDTSIDHDYLSPYSKLHCFFREYVDFKMFALKTTETEDPFEITEKILNCEFLYFECALSNADVLRDNYKGWGLVLHRKDPKIDFEFFYNIVKDWYSGKPSQWRFICITCDVPDDKWQELCDMGKLVFSQKKNQYDKHPSIFAENEIQRGDGETCRIEVIPRRSWDSWYKPKEETVVRTKIYFYLGENPESLLLFTAFNCRMG